MIRVGIIGLGYWGPNLVRCFDGLEDCAATIVCDLNTSRLAHVQKQFPDIEAVTDSEVVFDREKVDAVVIATPTKTHFQLARTALRKGLHTFVEKPLATTSPECRELIDLAEVNGCKLFVGHIFLHSAPVNKLKELVSTGDLGDVCYISSSRLNLGPVRRDVNALWDLAPHDISIMLELLHSPAYSVSCSGLAYLNPQLHDVCALTIDFQNSRMGIIHVSWLDPHKKRVMTVVGDKKMAVYDDLEPLEKIRIYDIGIDAPAYCDSFGEFQFSYRYGDIHSPRLEQTEPLKTECQHFIDSIVEDVIPKTDGYNGLEVVRVLEAAEISLKNGGGHVMVDTSGVALPV
jgi:predicted dehydrogenase